MRDLQVQLIDIMNDNEKMFVILDKKVITITIDSIGVSHANFMVGTAKYKKPFRGLYFSREQAEQENIDTLFNGWYENNKFHTSACTNTANDLKKWLRDNKNQVLMLLGIKE